MPESASRGVYLVTGGVLSHRGGGVFLVTGGVLSHRGGVPGPGGVCSRGGVPGQVLPPPVDRMTHAYENITLPQTLFAGGY